MSYAGLAVPPSATAGLAALHHESAVVVGVLALFALLLTVLVALLKDIHDTGGWWAWRTRGDAFKNQCSVSAVVRAQNEAQVARIEQNAEIDRQARAREARPRRLWRRSTPPHGAPASWSSHPQPTVVPEPTAPAQFGGVSQTQLHLYDDMPTSLPIPPPRRPNP